MFGKNLSKHLGEFRAYVGHHQYDVAPEGLYFPKAKALIHGAYTHNVNGEDEETDHNIIPNEGLNHFLNVVLLGTPAAVADWFLAIYATAYTPLPALTAASFTGTTGEHVGGTGGSGEGYNESTRILWAPDAVDTTNTEVTNTTTPGAFTIVTGSTLLVNGAGLLSASAKGATTGTLISAGRFAAQRSLSNGDIFNLKYKVDADAV